MKTIIHVNQHRIRANIKAESECQMDPVLTVKTYKENRYGNTVEILGTDGQVVARIVYRPHDPLSCGARAWIETENDVRVS